MKPLTPNASHFEKLIATNQSHMLYTLWRVIRDFEPLEEMMQLATLRAWQKRHLFAEHPNPTALLLRITRHIGYDYLRSRIRQRRLKRDYLMQNSCDENVSSARLPEDRLISQELDAWVKDQVQQMPHHQQIAARMKLFEGAEYEQIAQKIGCHISTARLHFWRAKQKLQNGLKKTDYLN